MGLKKRLLWFSALFLLTLLSYSPSLRGEFVFDDTWLIPKLWKAPPKVEEVWRALWHPPTFREFEAKEVDWGYRPLRNLSFLLDLFLSRLFFSKPSPLIFHLFNLFFHLATGFFVWLAMRKLGFSEEASFLATAFFLWHPVQTESVSYVSGRRDVLLGLFVFASFFYFLKAKEEKKPKSLFLFPLFFCLSLGVKEVGAILPLFFLFFLFSRGVKDEKLLWVSWGCLALSLLFVSWQLFFRSPLRLGFAKTEYWGGSLENTLLTLPRAVFSYVTLVLFPYKLTVDYSEFAFVPSRSFLEPPTTLPALFLLILLGVMLWKWRKKKYIEGAIWFFLFLLPVLQLIPHPERFAEHYLYVPLFGAAVFFGYLAEGKKYRWVVGVVLALLLFRTFWRNFDWQSSLTLWRSAVLAYPQCGRAQFAYGKTLLDLGDKSKTKEEAKKFWQKAYCHLQEAVSLTSRIPTNRGKALYLHSLFFLSLSAIRLGKWKEAEELLKKLLKQREARGILLWHSKDHIYIHLNLGAVYQYQGNFQKAAQVYRKILELRPFYDVALWELGKVYLFLGETEKAKRCFSQVVKKTKSRRLQQEALLQLVLLSEKEKARKLLWLYPVEHPWLLYLKQVASLTREEKKKWLKKLISLSTLSPSLCLAIARECLALGYSAWALSLFERIRLSHLPTFLWDEFFSLALELNKDISPWLSQLPLKKRLFWQAKAWEKQGKVFQALFLYRENYEQRRHLPSLKAYFLLYRKVKPEKLGWEGRKWVTKYPRKEVFRVVSGVLLLEKKFHLALEILLQGEKKFPGEFRSWIQKVEKVKREYYGSLRRRILRILRKKQWQKAEEILKKAMKFFPKKGELYQWMGEVLKKQKRWQEAKLFYYRAIRLYGEQDSFAGELWASVGECAYYLGEWQEAIQACQKALSLLPKYPLAEKYLRRSLKKIKREKK